MNIQIGDSMAQARTLVVYFSRTGTTRKIAETIAKALGSDLEEIGDDTPRQGYLGYWRSLLEARRHATVGIAEAKRTPASYDLVVIGTPVWVWSVSSPVRMYLTTHKASLPDVAFFCTMGGRGSTSTFREMQTLSGKAPRAVLAVTARDVAAQKYDKRLAEFIKRLISAS
jgi:flavodoxin